MSTWTDERVETARQMYLDGYSASQIAASLGAGCTRNAVIGKIHRGNWERGHKPALGWTPARRKLAAELYKTGAAHEDIAAQVGGGISVRAVQEMAKAHGGKRARPPTYRRTGTTTSLAALSAARDDGALKQGHHREAQKAVAERPARGAQASAYLTDDGKSSQSAAMGRVGDPVDPSPRLDCKPVTLLERGPDQCCWPLGDPRDFETFRYCGAAISGPMAYCDHHLSMYYAPGTTNGSKAARARELARRGAENRAIMAGAI